MKLKFLVTTLLLSIAVFAQKGTLTGTITDKAANNAVLAFATISIKGTSNGVTTDENGKYTLEVAEGKHVLTISFLGYETKEIPFNIQAKEVKTINWALETKGVELQDVVIKTEQNREKETALLAEQKKAVEIKQSIGAQELSRKGISDVEEGLTKITGITKVESRGLFVRGLEDRYNNLLINDLQAPSNSPFKKFIPLDMFPTDIVGVLNVYKTFNPNIPGDFAGATVSIETSQAKGSITKLNLGMGYTTQNNGEDFLISSDANSTQGYLGLIGKDRDLPGVFGNTPARKVLTPEEYKNAYSQNSWNVDNSSSPINTSVGLLHTERFALKNGNTLNYILSLNSENKYQIRKGVDRTFNQGQGNYDNNLYRSEYNYQTAASALAGIKYKANRFSVTSNTFYLRSTESKIQDQLGYTNSLANNPNMIIRLNQFEESNYLNTQLFSDIKLSGNEKHHLKIGGSYVKTHFDQPDRKFIFGEKTNETDIKSSYGGNNLNRQYLEVKGNYYMSGMAEYNWNISESASGKTNKLALGYNVYRNDLKSTYRFLSGRPLFPFEFTTNLNTINTQISNDVANGIVAFQEESSADYKVKFNQFVNAGYFNLFWNFGSKFEVNAGLRLEHSDRNLQFRSIAQSIGDPFQKEIDTELDFLPSVNAKYALSEKSNLRLAASQTITRPVAYELLPIQYVNGDGTVVQGNQKLENPKNTNIDLKFEFFPNSNEMFAIGVFGKKIINPIERIFIPTASSGGQITTYQNSKEATLFGAEAEFILSLEHLTPVLSDFSWGLNASLMATDVTVDKIQNPLENDNSRKLQGASDWLVNSDLKYTFTIGKTKNTTTFVYGVYGDRIYAVGTAGLDHIYEKPFQKLDFVWSSKLSDNIDVKFSVDNLLNPAYQQKLGSKSKVTITEDSLLLREYRRGTGFSLNLSYTF